MGSTPIYGIPYAEPTDLVRDWPELSEDVALAVEAALENIPVTQKKIEAFTGSGSWTVPAGVTYAIAHVRGGGGGVGLSSSPGGNGGASSVEFAGGTVSAPGNGKSISAGNTGANATAGAANSSQNAVMKTSADTSGASNDGGSVAGYVVAGDAVTPASSITVTVGAGGAAGSGGAAGGSGYVYIEYYEEV